MRSKEEILESHFPLLIIEEDEWGQECCKAMDEYASEVLRDELIKYDEYLDEYIDHKRSEIRVDEYLAFKDEIKWER